jgi:hypothetical protein
VHFVFQVVCLLNAALSSVANDLHALGVNVGRLEYELANLRELLAMSDTYWAVEHLVPLVSAFLDMVLESIRIQGLEQLEAA